MSGERCIIIIQSVIDSLKADAERMQEISDCLGDQFKEYEITQNVLLMRLHNLIEYAKNNSCGH